MISVDIAIAQENTGIIYGDSHVFSVKAPNGWVLDNQSGVSQGLQAVFYPKGSTWKDSIAMMYVNTASRDKSESLLTFITRELNDFKKESAQIQIKDAGLFKTQDGKQAVVKELVGDNWGNSELIAYIEEEKVFVMIVLNSRKSDEFEKSRLSFIELVGSYKFMKDFDYFELAHSIAKQQVATTEGKDYERAAMHYFGSRHASTMKNCFDKTKNPNDSAFTALVEIRADGKSSKILLKPESNIALCLKEQMKDDFYPKPPSANWWLSIDMKIKK